MSCDAGRPCSRCVKRDIAHLCREEPALSTGTPISSSKPSLPPPLPVQLPPSASSSTTTTPTSTVKASTLNVSSTIGSHPPPVAEPVVRQQPSASTSLGLGSPGLGGLGNSVPQLGLSGMNFSSSSFSPQAPMLTTNFNLAMLDLASGQDGMGAGLGLDMTFDGSGDGEFHGLGLSDFLRSLNNDSPFINDPITSMSDSMMYGTVQNPNHTQNQTQNQEGGAPLSRRETKSNGPSVPGSPINKTERFLLTAADQKDGSRSDRLARVIHAKFEAGLLRPYNHVAGYTRLMRWMADNMSQSSRQRTLKTLSEFRPAFRAIASGLTDLDLVFIEEAFERLLLDYDRVFSSMGIPSCLWRRTGEIYKGNKEFAALVGVPIEQLQGGKLAIYELMAEESAVNYWEKYGNIAFDVGQKAVLTSCVLVNQSVLSKKRKRQGNRQKNREDAMINCCFSFTIRRDSYAIPSMIVGNFLRF